MPLRLIGYWKAHLRDDLPLAQEVQTEYVPDVRQRVVRYLASGATHRVYRGYSSCRFGCEGPNGRSELTDGVWLWPEGLAHYVSHHSVALPPRFVRHALREFRAARPTADQEEIRETPDRALWISWARQCRLPSVERLLEEAGTAAAAVYEERLESARIRWETDLGTDERDCLTEHCAHRALSGKLLCGRCLANMHAHRGLEQAEDEQLRRVLDLCWPAHASRCALQPPEPRADGGNRIE